MTDRLLTVAAVADLLGLQPATIHDWVQQGRVRAVRLGGSKGGRLRIPESELLAKLDGWSTTTAAASSPRPFGVV